MTPPAQRKSRLAQRHYAAADEPNTAQSAPATQQEPEPSSEPAPKKPAGERKSRVTKRPAGRSRPEPPAGTEEFSSYWSAGTYDRAVAAYQVMQDAGAAPEAFNEWYAEQLDAFARMSVSERVEAVRTLPDPPSGRGLQRRHHIPVTVVERLGEAAAEDRKQLGIERRVSTFAGLAGRWAAERVRQQHQASTGAEDLPPARPLPRGRRPEPRRD